MSTSRPFVNRLLAATLLGLTLVVSLPTARATLPSDSEAPRTHETLTSGWRTHYAPTGTADPSGFTTVKFDDSSWREVAVPHNWESYEGYRQAKHGQLHGTAWYRRTFAVDAATLAGIPSDHRRVFLLFEGAGSYATVWVNGREVGRHAGGLTTFTIDVTAALVWEPGRPNLLVVKTEHPTGIRDLPWVCGGCERAYGFSEGSQPLGLFRPVHVVVTNALRIAPFGVHVWNDRSVSPESATAQVRTEIGNHGPSPRTFTLRSTLIDPEGRTVATSSVRRLLEPGATVTLSSEPLTASPARLWSLDSPVLYTVRSELVSDNGPVVDRVDTPFGFRWIDWPHGEDAARGTFLLNGKPVFLNGTCEYSHLLGGGHAFTAQQIGARVRQMQAAGFNAFRDAHHPHNLRYNAYWDKDGLAWWTQFGAHVWFDRDDFRTNYFALLREWVKERRNSPSLVMWGLQNESQLPKDFAAQCTALIRELDPTAVDQRLVVTCNGGTGTDWDVPQNWTGTYGGDPATYAEDLKRERLFGEYGGWRSADLAAPRPGERVAANSGFNEESFTALMETKVRLAHSVRDKTVGHFHWIFATHDNPGRHFGPGGEQVADGWALLDRVGPANNKGLLTTWGEPLDAYHMYRSNFAPRETQPMVVIAGANRADQLVVSAPVNRIIAYSNGDEVELFNGGKSLGVRTREGFGTHFTWENVALDAPDLRAVARVGGADVASDVITVPHAKTASIATPSQSQDTTAPIPGETVLYRVNCGGPDYVDSHGQLWLADRDYEPGDSWGAISWAQAYPHLPPAFASIRRMFVPISGTADAALYQDFRYGREQLHYVFTVPDGEYRVDLHFAEPWYGRGNVNAAGWRQFDVALNGKTVLRDLDLFREAGFGRAVRKSLTTRVSGGRLEISFPRVSSYQAIVSAISISTRTAGVTPPSPPPVLATGLSADATLGSWFNTAERAYRDADATIIALPETLRHQPWVKRTRDAVPTPLQFSVAKDCDVYVASDVALEGWEQTGQTVQVTGEAAAFPLFRKHLIRGERVNVPQAALAVLVPARVLAPAQAISALAVDNSTTPAAVWRAAGSLQRGGRPHGPKGDPLVVLPNELSDADWLLTPAQETSDELRVRFTAADTMELNVALDAAATVPEWLRDWTRPANQRVQLGSRDLTIYRKRFETGSKVVLGPNGTLPDGSPARMYGVFARAVRPAHTYPSTPDVLDVKGAVVEWTFQIGVGDRYGFVIPVRTAGGAAARIRYDFLDKDGNSLCADERSTKDLTTDSDGWTRWRLRTCTSVNAGTYKVRLTLVEPGPVNVGPLTVE